MSQSAGNITTPRGALLKSQSRPCKSNSNMLRGFGEWGVIHLPNLVARTLADASAWVVLAPQTGSGSQPPRAVFSIDAQGKHGTKGGADDVQ